MDNILTALNAGSGIDVRTLARELTEAERAPRQKLLDQRQERVEARISAMGQFRTAIDALVGALQTRIGSGVLAGIPAVSDPSILTFRVDPGVTVPRQSLEVRQLARAQTLASAAIADAAAPIGQGTLTIRFGTVAGSEAATGFAPGSLADLLVTIAPGDDSLTGLKNAINDAAAVAGAPVQAQIVTDVEGSRLILRGSPGAASGFLVETAGDPALDQFAFNDLVPGGLARTLDARDAIVAIDGVELKRPANAINDLIPGARLSLAKAEPGTIVTLEAVRDPAELSLVVNDIAGAFNELAQVGRTLSRGITATGSPGALVSDSATRRALSSLTQLTSRALIPAEGNAPTRLADIGLTLTREGNFTVDAGRLQRAVVDHPAAVEKLVTALNQPASFFTAGGPLRQLADSFRLAAAGSAGQPTALQREAQAIARERQLLDDRMERFQANMTRQFAALDRAVGQSRGIQTFLTQQIDIWTRRNDR